MDFWTDYGLDEMSADAWGYCWGVEMAVWMGQQMVAPMVEATGVK